MAEKPPSTYIRCIYGDFGKETTKFTVIYGAFIWFWPTLRTSYLLSTSAPTSYLPSNSSPTSYLPLLHHFLHLAVQYGQTAVLYHLALKWNADIDARDNDGRAPLHWASYKGYADTIRLLLVRCTHQIYIHACMLGIWYVYVCVCI